MTAAESPAKKINIWSTSFSVAFAAFFLFMLFRGPGERVGAYRELVGRHAAAKAVVSSTDCSDHGNVLYTFTSAGKTYSGNSHWLSRPCDGVQPGEVIAINFDPADPTLNTTMRPEEAYEFHKSQLTTKALMATAVLCFVAFPLLRERLGRKP